MKILLPSHCVLTAALLLATLSTARTYLLVSLTVPYVPDNPYRTAVVTGGFSFYLMADTACLSEIVHTSPLFLPNLSSTNIMWHCAYCQRSASMAHALS